MKIKWTHEALAHLIEIEDYISHNSTARAIQFVDQLIEHAESLADTPRMGRSVPELATPDIRELIFKKYRIVYRLQKNHIEILTVFEGHRILRTDELNIG
jgi:toxin ParE1/3/4